MDRSDVISLIDLVHTQGEDGVWTTTEKATEVFCDVRSITQTEWFEAGRNGIEHPSFVFVINRNEYGNQEAIKYNGQYYGVYRTYAAKNENLELYCEAKGGLHYVEPDDPAEPADGGSDGDPE